MPDILVFFNGFTIGIELKTKTRESPVQLDMFNRLQSAGVFVHTCRNVDEVEDCLLLRGIPMRKYSLARQENLTLSEGRRPKEPAQGTTTPA